jgi:hypothetical protein
VSTEEGRQPTEEELRAAFEEQMRRITVPDVLVQTAVTLVNLGSQKLGEDHDLEQAKLAVEGVRALLPLLPEEVQAPIRDALSQLQMAFAREAQGAGEPPAAAAEQSTTGEGEGQPAREATEPPKGDEDAERARARSKIWTPPGS